jgi:hypothetical protein
VLARCHWTAVAREWPARPQAETKLSPLSCEPIPDRQGSQTPAATRAPAHLVVKGGASDVLDLLSERGLALGAGRQADLWHSGTRTQRRGVGETHTR